MIFLGAEDKRGLGKGKRGYAGIRVVSSVVVQEMEELLVVAKNTPTTGKPPEKC